MQFDEHAHRLQPLKIANYNRYLSQVDVGILLNPKANLANDSFTAHHSAMTFSISNAIDEAATLGTWKAAYQNIMRALGFDEDDPDYFAEAMAGTAIDEEIVANWNKADPAQRQWMVTQIVSHEVKDSYDRRLAAAKDMVERLKEHVKSQTVL